jgi:hypothetical protein
MRKLLLILILLLAACQAEVPAENSAESTLLAFPTMTPGQVVRGPLPTVISLPLDGSSLGNPATAIALANRPTITPNYESCPASNSDATLANAAPDSSREINETLVRFLNDGGTVQAVETTLRETWGILGESDTLRGDLDLSGEQTPEIIMSYLAPEEGGSVVIFGCADGRYLVRYQMAVGSDEAPTLLNTSDLNLDGKPDLLFSGQVCDGAECQYSTHLLTWSGERGRFINLLSGELNSEALPNIEDIDADRVSEIVVRLTNPGDSETGPLRTGFTVYDWNGAVYTRSVTQLNPPRFRIQVVQQADAAIAARNTEEAVALYNLALTDPSLENWHNDDQTVLQSYVQYRLLLAYSDAEDPRRVELQASILQAYPDPAAAPVYVTLATTFWNALQVTNNLHSACLEVQDIITTRQEALTLLNRYGSRSPTYTATDVCPF